VEKIVLDTNVLIEILKGNRDTIAKVESFNKHLTISSISAMELFFGALNKAEVKKLEKFVSLFDIIYPNEKISYTAMDLVKKYAKSHTLDIPDSIIASTSLYHKCELFTYNKKDFRYIDNIRLV
jgi:predicted nucleic acid-binding protein